MNELGTGVGQSETFRDPELPIEVRLDDLIGRLTLDEKLDCLGTDPSVARLGIRMSPHVEGLHGLSQGGPGRWGHDEPAPTTMFPQAIGLAATWQPDLVQELARVEAREARYYFHSPVHRRGGLVVRAPNADLGRDPRWGRTEECFGEDPTLTARMAVAFVRGLHGEHPKYWQAAALLKHYFANSNEDGRESSSSDFDERQLREYYTAPFRAAVVEGGARAFMTAYNAVNGIPCTYHPAVKEVALAEWQQDGIVCTDAHAASMLVTHHKTCRDMAEAVARSIQGGITQFLDDYRDAARQALEAGLLSEADLDGAIRRTFRVMLRLGLLDPAERVPYASVDPGESEPWQSPEVQALCRRVTQQSIVLLKNTGSLLPLSAERRTDGKPRVIGVVGPLADRVHIDWYGGTPPYLVSPLEGIRERLGSHAVVESVCNNDVSAAMALAKRAEVCVVCVGNHPTGDAPWAEVGRKSYGKEAVDRKSLELEDERLVQAVFEANPRTVLVLVSSFPYAINWSEEHVPAIVQLTHSSQELGRALADVLFGDVNPAGRLVQTWPRALEDLPEMLDYDLTRGRTYLYSERTPLYPFGYGLSYTSFAYQRLQLSSPVLREGGRLELSVEIRNTGQRAGDEVVQLYVRYLESRVTRPRQQLVDFQRTHLEPGGTRSVELLLQAEQLAYWDAGRQCFVVESGLVELQIGRSSRDIELCERIQVG